MHMKTLDMLNAESMKNLFRLSSDLEKSNSLMGKIMHKIILCSAMYGQDYTYYEAQIPFAHAELIRQMLVAKGFRVTLSMSMEDGIELADFAIYW